MPLTFRDTKGSPLTSAEADSNIRTLAAMAPISTVYLQVKNYNGALVPHPTGAWQFVNNNQVITSIAPAGATIYDPSNNGAFVPPVTGIYQAIVFIGFAGGTVNGSSFNISINNTGDSATPGQIVGGNQWFAVNPAHPEGGLVRAFQLTAGQKVAVSLYVEGTGTAQMICVTTYSLIA